IHEVRRAIEAMTTSRDRLRLLVDASGLGAPVVELLEPGMKGSGFTLVPVRITSADDVRRDEKHPGGLLVGHDALVSRLRVIVEQGRVKMPPTEEAKVLVDELLNFERRVTATGHVSTGARPGRNDDLVLGLGL